MLCSTQVVGDHRGSEQSFIVNNTTVMSCCCSERPDGIGPVLPGTDEVGPRPLKKVSKVRFVVSY